MNSHTGQITTIAKDTPRAFKALEAFLCLLRLRVVCCLLGFLLPGLNLQCAGGFHRLGGKKGQHDDWPNEASRARKSSSSSSLKRDFCLEKESQTARREPDFV